MDSVKEGSIIEILETWKKFVTCTETLNKGQGDLAMGSQIVPLVSTLCSHGLSSLVQDHFLQSLEVTFKANAVSKFWKQFGAYCDTSKLDGHEGLLGEVLCRSLEGICSEMSYLERCLLILVQALQSYDESINEKTESQDCQSIVISKFQLMVSSVLLTTLPLHFQEILRLYFKKNLEELSTMIDADYENRDVSNPCDHNFNEQSTSHMDVDGSDHMPTISVNNRLVKSIGKVVRDLRSLGFTSLTEDAYASAIFFLLKNKVHSLAGEEYRSPVLESIKQWIQAVPMQFLNALLAYLGDSIDYDSPTSHKSPLASCPFSYPGIDNPSEGLVRWQLRLEYFAYETLQDLRIGKLFEIIVDYPDSSPAIEDLKQCLEYTGQHSKLVDSFISSLRYRLLTAGASTNDILHQYVSTIKALRTIDPAGVFLEAVGEPIRDYLKGRKDTIKCIVTMLTDGTGGNSTGIGNNVDSLLEEINKDVENQDNADCDEDINSDDKQAWMSAERWEPDPIEVDPLKGSRHRRKIDILAMMVSIIGSKEQLVNEYRVMLAEKLLNKSDYEIDSEIRTLELLKIHFGESIMQRCEIMTNDLIHSKRTNANIKASMPKSSISGSDQGESNLSLDHIDVTIISSNFWPPIQEEKLNLPSSIDQLLSDYAKRFHEVKTPRKLLWKKNLGTVKLELEFEDRTMQFTVTPLHATIIMQFQEQKSWTSKCLAGIVGVSDDLLHRKISYWVNKGVLIESAGEETNNQLYTLVDEVIDAYNNDQTSGNYDRFLAAEEEGEGSVASVEEQLRIEMTIYEKFIEGMLTNFGSLTLDRIHNSLKMFCSPEQPYDKSLQQLQSFLSSLISEDKLEMRDGFYYLKR